MQTLAQFQVQGYKTNNLLWQLLVPLGFYFFLITDCPNTSASYHHSSEASYSCDPVASANLPCCCCTNLAEKERLNQNGYHPITNTRDWVRALSQKKQGRETGPCQKSHEQRSSMCIKSTGDQPYSGTITKSSISFQRGLTFSLVFLLPSMYLQKFFYGCPWCPWLYLILSGL